MFDFIVGTALILVVFTVLGVIAKIFAPMILNHLED